MSKSIRISDEAKEIISKLHKITNIPEIDLISDAVNEFKNSKLYAQYMLFKKKKGE